MPFDLRFLSGNFPTCDWSTVIGACFFILDFLVEIFQPQSIWIGTGSVCLEIKTDYLENLNFQFASIVVTRRFDLSTR